MLTNAQKATLKAYILAQPDLSQLTSGTGTDYGQISVLLNADASPVALAWRTAVIPAEMDDAPDYSTFDSIVPGKRESWAFLLGFPRDFTRSKTRKWITDIWGNASSGSNAEAILLTGTENASRAEVALGGSTKTTNAVSALSRNWIGDLSLNDIAELFQ